MNSDINNYTNTNDSSKPHKTLSNALSSGTFSNGVIELTTNAQIIINSRQETDKRIDEELEHPFVDYDESPIDEIIEETINLTINYAQDYPRQAEVIENTDIMKDQIIPDGDFKVATIEEYKQDQSNQIEWKN